MDREKCTTVAKLVVGFLREGYKIRKVFG